MNPTIIYRVILTTTACNLTSLGSPRTSSTRPSRTPHSMASCLALTVEIYSKDDMPPILGWIFLESKMTSSLTRSLVILQPLMELSLKPRSSLAVNVISFKFDQSPNVINLSIAYRTLWENGELLYNSLVTMPPYLKELSTEPEPHLNSGSSVCVTLPMFAIAYQISLSQP